MRIAEMTELHNLLDFRDVTKELLKDAMKETMRLNDLKFNVKWIHKDHLEAECAKHATGEGWDLDKVLVVYIRPQDEGMAVSEMEDILQGLSKLNTTQCVCWFLSDMTLEKFADTINKVARLKAFL